MRPATKASVTEVASTHYHLGNLSAELGRVDAARRWLERAVDLAPDRALYYHALSDVKKFTADDRHFAGIEALARELATLSAQGANASSLCIGQGAGRCRTARARVRPPAPSERVKATGLYR